jgi:hypothetical protein
MQSSWQLPPSHATLHVAPGWHAYAQLPSSQLQLQTLPSGQPCPLAAVAVPYAGVAAGAAGGGELWTTQAKQANANKATSFMVPP